MAEFDFSLSQGGGRGSAPWPKTLHPLSVVRQVLQDILEGTQESVMDTALVETHVIELLATTQGRMEDLDNGLRDVLGREPTDRELLDVYRLNLIQAVGLVTELLAALPPWLQQLMQSATKHMEEQLTDSNDETETGTL